LPAFSVFTPEKLLGLRAAGKRHAFGIPDQPLLGLAFAELAAKSDVAQQHGLGERTGEIETGPGRITTSASL
jgi:hypothetical protein